MHLKNITYKADSYNEVFIRSNMMGPNSMIVLEELLENIELKKGLRVLDLGCGNGLTSIFLAKEYDVQVFAVDLWVSATNNYKRFQSMKLDDLIIPLQCDARALPFPDQYFDAVISVDAYHYFGNNDTFFNEFLARFLKDEAIVAFAFPGMKFELHSNIPEEMKELWDPEALEMWHSTDWWKTKLNHAIDYLKINEMKCFDRAWSDWLSCDNPYAIEDRVMIETDQGRFMNLIAVTGIYNK